MRFNLSIESYSSVAWAQTEPNLAVRRINYSKAELAHCDTTIPEYLLLCSTVFLPIRSSEVALVCLSSATLSINTTSVVVDDNVHDFIIY